MAKNYRTVQQWDTWFTHFLGTRILEVEQKFLTALLANYHSKHALLIGVPNQRVLLKSSPITHNIMLGPLVHKDHYIKYIESEFHELPIVPASVDVVILPHTLEYIDNPRQLLNEACRIVKPEGEIIIFGFNPYSLWGMKKWWAKNKNVPWSSNLLCAHAVREWLQFADFELKKQAMLSFRPPLQHHRLYDRLKALDWIGSKCHLPCGNIYVLIAKAKLVALTPVRLHWKQQLPSISSITLPGQTMRDMR